MEHEEPDHDRLRHEDPNLVHNLLASPPLRLTTWRPMAPDGSFIAAFVNATRRSFIVTMNRRSPWKTWFVLRSMMGQVERVPSRHNRGLAP